MTTLRLFALVLATAILCSGCRDQGILNSEPEGGTPRQKVTQDPPSPKKIVVQDPPAPKPSQENTNALAKSVASNRAKGDVLPALEVMHDLMQHWSPVGLSKGQVMDLLGPSTSESAQEMVYLFDRGFGGWQLTFIVTGGIVSEVRKEGLE